MDYKQYVLDYLAGRVPYEDFQNTLDQDEAFIQWFQDIMPETEYSLTLPTPENQYHPEKVPFDMRLNLAQLEYMSRGKGSRAYQLNLQGSMEHKMKTAFPGIELEVDPTLSDLCSFLYQALPQYVDGYEVQESGILDRILDELPQGLSKAKRVKAFKDRIKQEFHLDGKHYPHWVQNPEWPMSNGKPMKFVKTTTKVKNEWYQHHFVDVDTGEERIVDDML